MHIHLDLIGGLAGDMFLAAALDANLIDVSELEATLRTIGLGDKIRVVSEQVRRGALSGTHVKFADWDPDADSDHRHLSTIETMIVESGLDEDVKTIANDLFQVLGRSEAKVHDIPMERVHFHEVGAVDSLLDFISAAFIIAKTGATWSFGPVPNGRGMIETAHGTIPVPAPATADILQGFEMVLRDVEAELVTPTGASILAGLPRAERPDAKLATIGYGAGTKEFGMLSNVVRMMVFEASASSGLERDQVARLECEIDDMNPELLARVADVTLFGAGAIDVVRQAVQMKKGRQGTRLTVLAPVEKADEIAEVILRETTTFGVRVDRIERMKLGRRKAMVKTTYGEVEVKVGVIGDDVVKVTPEFESCAHVAAEFGVPIREVWEAVVAAADAFTE